MKLLSEADVARLVDIETAITASADAYVTLSERGADVPPRSEIVSPDVGAVIMVMPGLVREKYFGVKLVSTRHAQGGAAPLSISMLLLFDALTLEPLGLISSDHFTDLRTAAGLAAATRALALPDARVHTVYGAGKLAGPSVRMIGHVRPIEEVIIAGRSPERLKRLVDELSADPALASVKIVTGLSAEEAAARADIITTVTTSDVPVFDGSVVRNGTHINVGGAFKPTSREVDDHIARQASYFVDSEASCLTRAGDLVIPMESGTLTQDRICGEIGAVIAGTARGRVSDDEITVFKSLGNAIQDLILGERLLTAPGKAAGLDFDFIGAA